MFAEDLMVNDLAKRGDAVWEVEQDVSIDEVAFSCRGKVLGGESEWLEFFWCEEAADPLLEF